MCRTRTATPWNCAGTRRTPENPHGKPIGHPLLIRNSMGSRPGRSGQWDRRSSPGRCVAVAGVCGRTGLFRWQVRLGSGLGAATNAATARNRRASCADGDRCRASPTRSLTHHQRPRTQSVSGINMLRWPVRRPARSVSGSAVPENCGGLQPKARKHLHNSLSGETPPGYQ